ncbi:MAG TPA: hypothetical protein PKZ32_06650 [Candidatus Melainabacteria bacterium]|nr:hypothetical protein [Candidatus Melainabacteria bacterium]
MNKKPIFLAVSILAIALAAAIGAQNFDAVTIKFFGNQMVVPFAAAAFVMFACGGASTLPALLKSAKEAKSEELQVSWQKQDEKLKEELTNDKIKMLEAKIATLDAALKQSLKKK